MLRVLAVIAWIAITVYAIADWYRTPEEELPARMPKAMWLVLIIITIPSFSLGAIAWIVVRAMTRAEAGQPPLPPLAVPRPPRAPAAPPRPIAPDDDPEFLFRIERDIQREKRAREGERRESGDAGRPAAARDSADPSPDPADSGEPGSPARGADGPAGRADSAEDHPASGEEGPSAPRAD